MHYRLRYNNKEEATQLLAFLDWDGETHYTTTNENGRVDIVALGDLPQQNLDGSIIVVDESPLMQGFYFVDILSEYELKLENVVKPSFPQHSFMGH